MTTAYNTSSATQAVHGRTDRWTEVELLEALRQEQYASDSSVLQFAKAYGVPESTLRHWVSRAEKTEAPGAFVAFCESPEGLRALHQIVTAATYVMTQELAGGVRSVCRFLELSGLGRVVASGYGTQQQAVQSMEETLVAFGAAQKQRLAANMAPKDITLTQDETFHDRPCLVAMEPVSNFIVVEEYADDRRAETWNQAVKRGLCGLPVMVIQSTSDEGSALLKHARTSLKAHHSPDLFHPQQDISRATSLVLRRLERAAKDAADDAAVQADLLQEEADAYDAQHTGPGRRRDYATRIRQSRQALDHAEYLETLATQRRKTVRTAARAISTAYHPFDLKSGSIRDSDTVEAELNRQFGVIDTVATQVGLSAKCCALLKKARRVVPQMVATIAFVHTVIQKKINALHLTPAVEATVMNQLIPMYYIERVASKASTAAAREELRAHATELRRITEAAQSPLSTVPDAERANIDHVALECANVFQRASSNVEGRNGVLALRHHSTHHISNRKLAALTVVHNYGVTRPDGTTAAERLFGQPHDNLFEHLLMSLPPPKRPAARRTVLPKAPN